MPLSPETSYYQIVPVEDFHKVALDLSVNNPIASRVIRQKDANYIVKFVSRNKPKVSSDEDLIKNMMLQKAKNDSLLYHYQDLVFNKEYDLEAAFRGNSSKNHNIQINKAYLAISRQG